MAGAEAPIVRGKTWTVGAFFAINRIWRRRMTVFRSSKKFF